MYEVVCICEVQFSVCDFLIPKLSGVDFDRSSVSSNDRSSNFVLVVLKLAYRVYLLLVRLLESAGSAKANPRAF